MEIEYGAAPEPEPKLKYDFTDVRNGATIWVATNNERMAITKAFIRWKESRGSNLSATSAAVGAKDPRGAGYRIWFKSEATAIRPVVAAKLPKIESLDEFQLGRLRYSGIETNEDVVSAVMSTGSMPATVTEAIAMRKVLFALKTPFQIESMARRGVRTPEQIESDYLESECKRRKASDWPEDDGREVSPTYANLTDEQRRTASREALINDEDEYNKAMRSRPIDEPKARSLDAVINGYSSFSTWKVRRMAASGDL